MFWQNFETLCRKNGKSPNSVCSELGFSNSASTHWKNGKQPRKKTLEIIAEYFNVTTDSLLQNKTTTPEEQSLTSEEQLLLSFCKDLSVDDLKKVIEYVELLKLKGNQ